MRLVKAISCHGFLMLFTHMAALYMPVKLAGQEPVFRHYSTRDGLPGSKTYCVVQDHRGYLYFGKDRGLARYDGYNFEIFSSAKGNLPDNTIFGLYKDIHDRIWYQSFSGNAGYFYKDSFYIYPYNHLIHKASPERKEGIGLDLDGRYTQTHPPGMGQKFLRGSFPNYRPVFRPENPFRHTG